MTRRERLERKAEAREQWAKGRASKADGLRKQNEPYVGDHAFATQPGYIPERARANRRDAKAHEHGEMARHHQEKAAALRSHLNRTIFSDDENAIRELEAKIERLEAEREHAKTVNRAWRGAGKPSPDDADGWGKVADKLGVALDDLKTARLNLARDCLGRAPYPSYVSQNLGGRIRQARQRIDSIRRHAEKAAKAEDAGGVVIEDTANGYCTVSFAEKPDRSVLDALKAAGFRWSRPSWWGKRADLPDEVTDAD